MTVKGLVGYFSPSNNVSHADRRSGPGLFHQSHAGIEKALYLLYIYGLTIGQGPPHGLLGTIGLKFGNSILDLRNAMTVPYLT
jgi:hypothetical protein